MVDGENRRGGARKGAGRPSKNNIRRGISIYLPPEGWNNLELVAKDEGFQNIGEMFNDIALRKSKKIIK